MLSRERLVEACANRSVDRPPVWLMRQAGRYLPEYQEIRKKHTFWEMMRTPDLAVEVTLQPIRRFGMDAAILFSDILVVLDAMGFDVAYTEKGPVISPLIRNPQDLEKLTHKPIKTACSYVGDSLRLLCRKLHPEVGVIGFAGAPFTLAAYATESGPQRSIEALEKLADEQPQLYDTLLMRLTDGIVELLGMQIEAGADVVQLFDTWANRLTARDYSRLAKPYTQRVIERIQGFGVPVVLYIRNADLHLEQAYATGCSVTAIDESLTMAQARNRLGPQAVLQGNFNPERLHDSADRIQNQVREMIMGTNGMGHIVNLGRGLTPDSPVEGVERFVRAVREWKA